MTIQNTILTNLGDKLITNNKDVLVYVQPTISINPNISTDYWNNDNDFSSTTWNGTSWEMGFTGQSHLTVDGNTNPDWWVGFRPTSATVEWNDGTSGASVNIPVSFFDESDNLIGETVEVSTSINEESFTTVVSLDFSGTSDINSFRVGTEFESQISEIELISLTFT